MGDPKAYLQNCRNSSTCRAFVFLALLAPFTFAFGVGSTILPLAVPFSPFIGSGVIPPSGTLPTMPRFPSVRGRRGPSSLRRKIVHPISRVRPIRFRGLPRSSFGCCFRLSLRQRGPPLVTTRHTCDPSLRENFRRNQSSFWKRPRLVSTHGSSSPLRFDPSFRRTWWQMIRQPRLGSRSPVVIRLWPR